MEDTKDNLTDIHQLNLLIGELLAVVELFLDGYCEYEDEEWSPEWRSLGEMADAAYMKATGRPSRLAIKPELIAFQIPGGVTSDPVADPATACSAGRRAAMKKAAEEVGL